MAGFSAFGTKLRMKDDSTTALSSGDEIGDLTGISGPTMSAEEIDVTSHDSTGAFREFVPSFLDPGEISLEGNLMSGGGAEDMVDAFNDRKLQNIEIIFPTTDDLKWSFNGYVTGVETDAPYDDKATFSATIKVSGAPTLGAAAATTSTST